MNTIDLIKAEISESIATKQAVLEALPEEITKAGELISTALKRGNKVLCCGNGGSAADAQHFSAELLGRYVKERPGLPAIALTTDTSAITAIANDYDYQVVFARQIQALGTPGDVLLAITTSGNSENIIEAIKEARSQKMQCVVLTGKGGGKLNGFLKEDEINLCVPAKNTSRVQESHILIIHCLCEIIDL